MLPDYGGKFELKRKKRPTFVTIFRIICRVRTDLVEYCIKKLTLHDDTLFFITTETDKTGYTKLIKRNTRDEKKKSYKF